MTKSNCVDLEKFMEDFARLEQNITVVHSRSSSLEILLEDASRRRKMGLTKEKSLSEEKDGLLVTIRRLQETLQEQCNLREENDRLKTDVLHLKEHIERTREVGEAELQRLVSKLQADGRRRKVELEAVRLGCSREVEDARRDAVMRLDAKEAEMKKLLQEKDLNVEEMKKKLKDQEKQRQSELLKLQMEFGAKLARVQSSAERSLQQQQQGSGPLPHSIFKRKLQFFQEEKNKEITALRQRIRELEENQRVCSLKRRKP
ncbi:coiled-coil domain-containing protein 152 isoform X2 [Oryzias latipes]|uniref:Coiled-coil domain containing 152 n=1 Tax=Oryzias latipes TaxID=8090 RepID=H2MIP2_ORYLA|nr:coiled-coil domain-containing protein 152 isoform X2 [Oryzias latipes]